MPSFSRKETHRVPAVASFLLPCPYKKGLRAVMPSRLAKPTLPKRSKLFGHSTRKHLNARGGLRKTNSNSHSKALDQDHLAISSNETRHPPDVPRNWPRRRLSLPSQHNLSHSFIKSSRQLSTRVVTRDTPPPSPEGRAPGCSRRGGSDPRTRGSAHTSPDPEVRLATNDPPVITKGRHGRLNPP